MRRLLLDLDSYGGTDEFGRFPFLKRIADVLAPRLAVVFLRLLRLGRRLVNVIIIPWKGVHLPPQ